MDCQFSHHHKACPSHELFLLLAPLNGLVISKRRLIKQIAADLIADIPASKSLTHSSMSSIVMRGFMTLSSKLLYADVFPAIIETTGGESTWRINSNLKYSNKG